MTNNTVKGFKDISGKQAEKRAVIKEVIRRTFEKYNYEQAETPIIEYEEFMRGENLNNDVISDIFKLKDKGNRKLALRYEFTFQLQRLAKNKKLPYKRFQIGPVFRDEPVQGNRLRQFTQCDVDVVGSTVKDEAEILTIISEIFNALKVKFKIYVNNRKLLNEILDKKKIKNKEKVIREFDKLDKLPRTKVRENLKKLGAEKILGILKQNPEFFRRYKSFSEIEELIDYCEFYGVKVEFAPFLARGLSYYNGGIFEVKSNIKETICAGGSYLVNGIQSTGISIGLERLELVTKMIVDIEKYLIVSLNEDKKAIALAQKLRKQGKNTTIFYGKPSKALEYANSYKIQKVIFVGAKEVKAKKFKVKVMKTGKQNNLKI